MRRGAAVVGCAPSAGVGRRPGERTRAVLLAAGLSVAGLPGALLPGPAPLGAQSTGEVRDTATASDTLSFLLEPITVAVARERAMPPPVASLTVDPVKVRSSQASDPYLMLRQVAGVEVHDQGQGPGFASNVVMRGFTSDHSADVLLVIDGVPVNLPAHGHVEGFADWNLLMPSTVSSLRVIHGNASPLYGDFALAGAVEVFTRADADGGEAFLGGSNFGDLRGGVSTGRRGDDHGFFVATEGRRQEGWRENDDYWLMNGLARGWRSVAGGRLEGGISLYRTEWNSPGFVSVPDFNARRVEPAVDGSDGGESRRAVAHLRYARPFGAGSHVAATAWAQASDYAIFLHIPGHSHGAGSGTVVQSGEWDERFGAGGRLEVGRLLQGGDLTFGLSARADGVSYAHAATFRRDVLESEIELDATHRAGALYGRWRRQVGSRLALDLGARIDVVRHASTPRVVQGEVTPNAEEAAATNTVFGPKLGARLRITDGLSLRASSSRGFRSPVGIIGDPRRDPYLSWSHEVGLTHRGDALSAEVSVFRIDVDNERVLDPVTRVSSGAGRSVRQGVDGHLQSRLRPWFGIEVGGTWNHARLNRPYANAHDDHPHDVFAGSVSSGPDAPDPADADLRVPGVAEFSGHVRGDLSVGDDWVGWVGWQVVGSHLPIGEPGVETRSYSLLDMGAAWDIGNGRVLEVEVGNLLDVRFVELRSSAHVTPGMPRSVRVQMRVSELPF